MIHLAGGGHQLFRAFEIARLLRQRVVFRMDRRDVVVLADRAESVDAEGENRRIVDRHLQRIAHLLVVIGLLLDIGTSHDCRRRLDVRANESGLVHDRDIGGIGLHRAVELLRLESADGRRNVGAVIDELDAVEIGFAAPPLAVRSALESGFLADLEGNEFERGSADRMLDQILAIFVEIAVNDQARIVRHARNDGDVRLLQRQLDGRVVDLDDRAVASLLGRGIDQRRHARRHGIAFGALVAPAVQVVNDVVGVEDVAVVPGHALADVQDIFGRVRIDVPFLQQRGLEGELTRIGHQGIEELPGDIAHFRPIVGARVLLVLDEHAKAQNAALLRLLGESLSRRGQTEHSVSRGGRGAEDGRQRQKLAAVDRALFRLFGPGLQRFSRKAVLERFPDHDVLPFVLFDV